MHAVATVLLFGYSLVMKNVAKSCLCLAIFFNFTVPEARAAAPCSEWVLEQRHVKVGVQTVYVSQKAVKICNHERGFEVLARHPNWNIEIRRNDNKSVFYLPYADFSKFSLFGDLFTGEVLERDLTNLGHARLKGLTVTGFRVDDSYKSIILVADEITVPPQILTILSLYYGIVRAPGLIIREYATDKSGGVDPIFKVSEDLAVDELVTRKFLRKKFDDRDFEPSKGYRKAKSAHALLFSEAKRHKINEDLRDLGF